MDCSTSTFEFDPVTQSRVDGVIDHINANHADTVLLVARHLDPGALDAELSSISRSGAVFEVRDRAGAAAAVQLRVLVAGR